MKTQELKVYFEDGNTLTTRINGSKAEATKYYLNKYFQFGDTEECPVDKMVKAIKVEFIKTFKFSFIGRKVGNIGKTYKINTKYKAFSQQEAFNQLYTDYEHISTLCLNGNLLSHIK